MERVALDPLAAVEQPAQRADGRVDRDPGQVLERVDGAHLVGDRADPADAGDDVEDLVRRPADDQLLEVARRLEDREVRLDDLAVADDAGGASPRPRRGSDPGDLEADFAVGVIGAVHQACLRPAVAPWRRHGDGPGRSAQAVDDRAERLGVGGEAGEERGRVGIASGRRAPNQRARLVALAPSRGPKQP